MIEMVKRPDIYGSVIFCDDIRFEADGKVSYIGVYSGRITVHTAFSVTLPKFGVSIDFSQNRAVFENKIGLKIILPGDTADKPSIETDLEPTLPVNSDPKRPLLRTRAHIVFAPFILKSPGILRIRALHRDKLYPLGNLRVEQGVVATTPKNGETSSAEAISDPSTS